MEIILILLAIGFKAEKVNLIYQIGLNEVLKYQIVIFGTSL